MNGFSDRMGFALRTARGAGAITMRWFLSGGVGAERKADGSPVTRADREAERFVRDEVAGAFPGDGVIGEEYPPVESTTGRTWVIDPIDGTVSFVHGVPLFGTMLACMTDGEPTMGVIFMPALDECVAAEVGAGCWWWRGAAGPVRAWVSDTGGLDGAMVLSTSLEYYKQARHKHGWGRFAELGARTRGWSDCYAFVLVATGRADAVIEPGVKLWDIAAAAPILSEAGGAWSDLEGSPDLNSGSIVGSNGRIHRAVLDVLRGGPGAGAQ